MSVRSYICGLFLMCHTKETKKRGLSKRKLVIVNDSKVSFSLYFRRYKRSVVFSTEVRIFIIPTRAAGSCDENPLW